MTPWLEVWKTAVSRAQRSASFVTRTRIRVAG